MTLLFRRLVALVVAVLSTMSLMFLYVKLNPTDQVTEFLFPPTTSATEIINTVLSSVFPIRDIRWNGRLVQIDNSGIEEEKRINISRSLSFFSLQRSLDSTKLCTDPDGLKDTL